MFDKKGQSALEYLMTYGWALVVIVIVIAALVILVGTPGGGDSCSGSTKFTVVSLRDTGGDLNIIMTNATGHEISSTTMTTNNGVSGTGINDPWDAGITDLNGIIFSSAIPATGSYSTTITITYNDQYGNPHTETMGCSGTAG